MADDLPPFLPLFDYLAVVIPRTLAALESIAASLEKMANPMIEVTEDG